MNLFRGEMIFVAEISKGIVKNQIILGENGNKKSGTIPFTILTLLVPGKTLGWGAHDDLTSAKVFQNSDFSMYLEQVRKMYFKRDASCFSKFFREELGVMSKSYAQEKVMICQRYQETNFNDSGGVLAFLHFGNFFLSGIALCEKLLWSYTAIASKVNIQFMPKKEAHFWEGVHQQMGDFYSRDLFFTTEYLKKAIQWVRAGNYLGVAMDVIEKGRANRLSPFKFLGENVYFQTSAARIAGVSKKPIIPMCIVYCPLIRRHKLHLGDPVLVYDEQEATAQALAQIEFWVKGREYQFFHDIHKTFQKPTL